MRVEVVVPQSAMPKKDPEHPCPCQFRQFQLKEKTGELTWLVETGERVEKDQVICEGEVEKKTLEFLAPCDGVFVEKCLEDDEEFEAGEILGYVETDIELFLISGFLGSGKTTFIQNILKDATDKRIGVIVNEFGSVNIDGKVLKQNDIKMVEINNGSIFCACLKGGFVKTLAAFLQQPIDCLYIEASGMADPSSMMELLEQLTPLLQKKYKTERRYSYKGSICIVDAGRFLDLSECIPAIGSQIEKSGLLVLNKTDTVTENGLALVHEELKKLNSKAFLYDTSYAKVPDDIIEQYLNGEIEKVTVTKNTASNRPFGGILTVPVQKDMKQIEKFLQSVAEKMIRIKGFFKTETGCIHVDCVSDDIRMEEIAEPEDHVNQIVLISSGEENCSQWLKEQWEQVFSEEFVFEEE